MVAGLYLLVIPAGFEPAISWMRTRCPEPLDDGTTYTILNYKGSNLGFGHLRRPRNFAIENKFSSEDFLANCPGGSSRARPACRQAGDGTILF